MIDTGIGILIGASSILDHRRRNFDFYTGSAVPAAQSSEESPTNNGPKRPRRSKNSSGNPRPGVVPGRRADGSLESPAGVERHRPLAMSNISTAPGPRRFPTASITRSRPTSSTSISAWTSSAGRAEDIKETAGSLQMFVENTIRESDRKREKVMPPDPQAFEQTKAELKVFETSSMTPAKTIRIP